MSLIISDEGRWEEALQAAGKAQVQRYLREYPGQDDDPVNEFVYKPPYPTRQFCEEWLERENDVLFRVSPPVIGSLCMLVLVAISGCFGATHVMTALNTTPPN